MEETVANPCGEIIVNPRRPGKSEFMRIMSDGVINKRLAQILSERIQSIWLDETAKIAEPGWIGMDLARPKDLTLSWTPAGYPLAPLSDEERLRELESRANRGDRMADLERRTIQRRLAAARLQSKQIEKNEAEALRRKRLANDKWGQF